MSAREGQPVKVGVTVGRAVGGAAVVGVGDSAAVTAHGEVSLAGVTQMAWLPTAAEEVTDRTPVVSFKVYDP